MNALPPSLLRSTRPLGRAPITATLAMAAALAACSSGGGNDIPSGAVVVTGPSGAPVADSNVDPTGAPTVQAGAPEATAPDGTGAMPAPGSAVPTVDTGTTPSATAPDLGSPNPGTAPMATASPDPTAGASMPPAETPPPDDVVDPTDTATGLPEGAIVLFDGTNLDEWESITNAAPAPWRLIAGEVAMEVIPGTGNIVSKQKFEDVFVHLEYWTPQYPSSVTGQRRGNSGIYLKRAYEMQVLDTFGLAPAIDTCGAVYGIQAPPVSACLREETWNTYEIEFQASTWNGTTKMEQAVMVSATLNGQLIQENVPLSQDPTASGIADAAGPQSLMLQDHDPDGRVRFRNIWVIPR